jgi:hypothetical protein
MGIEYDGGGEDRAEQRASASLIDPGDGMETGPMESSLVAAGGHVKRGQLVAGVIHVP